MFDHIKYKQFFKLRILSLNFVDDSTGRTVL